MPVAGCEVPAEVPVEVSVEVLVEVPVERHRNTAQRNKPCKRCNRRRRKSNETRATQYRNIVEDNGKRKIMILNSPSSDPADWAPVLTIY